MSRFVFAGPSGLPGLMRFEAEVESGKGRQVWAAIEELAASDLKGDVAATMDQARVDALVDLVLANVSVSTVVDLALPAGFASYGSVRASSSSHCGRGSALEDRAIGALVDVEAHSDKETGSDAGQGNVFRLLAGLPIAGVLDHRVGTLTNATIEAILADPDTVFRRLVVDPDTGWLLNAGAATNQPGRHLARTVRKRDLHLGRPAHRAGPHHRTRRLPRALAV